MKKNRQTKDKKKEKETSPHLVGCVYKKAVLPEGSAVSLQDREGRRLKAVELDGPLFCGLIGRSKVRFGFLSLARCLGKAVGEVRHKHRDGNLQNCSR